MGLLSWFRSRRTEREFVPPEQLVPPFSNVFGPGLSNQPSHEELLRGLRGVADMATRAIANRVSQLELEVYVEERVADGTTNEEVLDDHALKDLLDMPSPTYSCSQLLRLTTQYVATVGEAYWLKVRSGFGTSVQLDSLPPSRMRPLVDRNVVNGYAFLDGAGAWKELPADAVIRFWFPDPESPFESEGYLAPNRNIAQTQEYSEQHLESHYRDNAIPPSVIKSSAPEATTPKGQEYERWQKEWLRRYHQRKGTHSGMPAWLPVNWDIVFSAMQTGADITPLLEYMQTNMLMNYGVPKSTLGVVVSGDRSSAETNDWVFDSKTVTTFTSLIEQALTKDLASEFDPNLKVRFKEFIQRNNDEIRAQESHDLTHKIRVIDEIRVKDRGEESVPWGNQPVGNISEVPYTGDDFMEPSPSEPEPDEPETEEPEAEEPRQRRWSREERVEIFGRRAMLYEELFNERYLRAMRRIFRAQERKTLQRYSAYAKGDTGRKRQQRPDPAAFSSQEDFMAACVPEVIAEGKSQAQAVGQCNGMWEGRSRALHARVEGDDLFEESEWLALFVRILEPVVRSIYARVGTESLQSLGGQQFIFNEAVTANIQSGIQELVEQTGNTTLTNLTRTLQEGTEAGESVDQLAKRIRGVFRNATSIRARTIARTETLRATQRAQVEGFEQSNVVAGKQWNTSLDSRVRDEHIPMEGVIVELNEDFIVGGERASAPGDPRLSAGNSINCRCFIVPILEDEMPEPVASDASDE